MTVPLKVLIIGATSAVAQQVIARYAGAQAEIFCLARNAEAMAAIAEQHTSAIKGHACFDFTDASHIERALDQAFSCLQQVDVVLLAHGYLPDQLATEGDIALMRATFEANCLSAITLVMAISARLERQGHGKLGVITSVAGDRGRPRNYTYGAAKGAVTLYLQGLRSRLYHTGVEVYTFKLGPVDTPMTVDHEKNFSFTTAENAADCICRAYQGKRYEVYIPGFWRWVMLSVRNMPEFIFQRLGFLSGR